MFQCDKLREEIAKVKEMLAKKDDVEPEELRKTTSALQQSSLKLFEIAYKKVSRGRRILSVKKQLCVFLDGGRKGIGKLKRIVRPAAAAGVRREGKEAGQELNQTLGCGFDRLKKVQTRSRSELAIVLLLCWWKLGRIGREYRGAVSCRVTDSIFVFF